MTVGAVQVRLTPPTMKAQRGGGGGMGGGGAGGAAGSGGGAASASPCGGATVIFVLCASFLLERVGCRLGYQVRILV